MTVSINLGDAFLLDTPPYGEHLYIAIAKTSENKYLFVNVTSRRENSETTCILNPSPELPPFIRRESVIAYQFAREMSATDLAKLVTPDSAISKGSCSASMLEKIQQGGLISRRLSNRYKTALRNFLATE
jgi:hypothetical protein